MRLSTLPTAVTLLLAGLAVGEKLQPTLALDLMSLLTEGEDVEEGSDMWTSDVPHATTAGTKIPGDNPLYLCADEQQDDLVQMDDVDLVPNPPVRGQELLVNASGALSSTIDKGSFVHIQVKLAGTRIVNKKYDLCAGLKRFGQSCPFNAGYISVSKGFKIDKMIPRGKYFAHIRIATAENTQITCFTGSFKL